jgi:ribosome-binding factor A
MMTSKRQQRIAEQIREILSELLQYQVDDPRLESVTVMDVRIDREFMYADVYVSALGDDERRDEVMGALEGASGFLRHELGAQIRLRNTPELRFHWDDTLASAEHIDRLLDELDIPPAED